MYRVLVKSVLVTLAVIAAGQVLSYSGRAATGQEFTLYVFAMNTLLPLATAMPASLLIFWQQHRLKLAHGALLAAHKELAIKASHDDLTGLLNRGAFLARLVEGPGQPGIFLAIDVDNFKQINDNFGHAEGDAALQRIAKTLLALLPDDAFAGRLGGEEFAVYLPDTTLDLGRQTAEKLRQAISAIPLYPARGVVHHLTVSIGIAAASKSIDVLQTFRQADANLYRAKAAGRNVVMTLPQKPQLAVVK